MQSLNLRPLSFLESLETDPLTERIRELVRKVSVQTGAFCEVFLEQRIKRQYDKALFPISLVGLGLQMIDGEKRLYLSSGDLSEYGIRKLTEEAIRLFRLGKPGGMVSLSEAAEIRAGDDVRRSIQKRLAERLYVSSVRARHGSFDEGRILCQMEASLRARVKDAGIELRTLSLSYEEDEQSVLIINSQGTMVQDVRHHSLTGATFALGTDTVSSDRTQYVLEREIRPEDERAIEDHFLEVILGTERMRKAKTLARLGRERGKVDQQLPVVLAPGEGGTLWHESCGHQLEAIAVWRAYQQVGYMPGQEKPGSELIGTVSDDFAFRLGEKVASSKVTLIDDSTLKDRYGSQTYDDEGHPATKNVLIENGVLKQYLCDRYAGGLIGSASNGCGRRQNYTFAPISRMSNTYLAAGEDEEEKMIREVPFGLYVKRFGGGSGGRIFSLLCSEAYLIENGEIKEPVARCMLTGRGIDVIKKVDRVGRRPGWDMGSFCGASSGLIPTTASQPMVRISEMKVGV